MQKGQRGANDKAGKVIIGLNREYNQVEPTLLYFLQTYQIRNFKKRTSGYSKRIVRSCSLMQSGIVIPQEYVNILIGQANGEADLVSKDLVKLLGREPTILKSYLAEQYAI